MKILLFGYGKMGEEVAKVAAERKHEVAGIITSGASASLPHADMAFEFTTPEAAPENILRCFSVNLPVVCGTTGWNKRLWEIMELCRKTEQTFFYAPNFSIGVNLLFEINKKVAALMRKFREYEVRIEETHRAGKKDAPSGTALALAEDIIRLSARKKRWQPASAEPAGEEVLPVKSIRAGEVPGIHMIRYESPDDAIEICHRAVSRRGFAVGAVIAAEWLRGKRGCFGMKDMLNTSEDDEEMITPVKA